MKFENRQHYTLYFNANSSSFRPTIPSHAFVRSGYVALSGGKAYVVGRDLYGWSRVASSASVTYNVGVNPTEVYPSNNAGSRWYGLPLRCLYLGSV